MSGHEQYQELVEQLKRIPISEIYSRYIGDQFKRRGSKAVAHCPFHGGDDSPSLTLYLEKNNWYCYGCQRCGTVIDLVMSALGVNFKTAVTALSGDYGFSSQEISPGIREQQVQARQQYIIDTELAADYDRIFSALIARRQLIAASLITYFDYDENPELVHELSLLDYIIDELAGASSADNKLQAWRFARRNFPWLKT